MDDETNNGSEGFLGKAKRLADRVGDYARSDDAREKLDTLKKKAAEAGKLASAGAKRVAEGTKQAAVQAREKADEFSKSERGEALKAKAREDWDEIRSGSFRGSKFTDSPVVVGMMIFVFFPLGLYLLWKHPVLGRSRRWWGAGGVWSLIVFMAVVNGDKEKRSNSVVVAANQANSPPVVRIDRSKSTVKEIIEDLPAERITPEVVLAAVSSFDVSGIDYSKGPDGEPIVSRKGVDDTQYNALKGRNPTTESGYLGSDNNFILHGLRTTWFDPPTDQSTGKRFREAFYFKGEEHGRSRYWRRTGEIEEEQTRNGGQQDGLRIWYYRNGRIGLVQEWKLGSEHGLKCKWHENGRVESVEGINSGLVGGKQRSRFEGMMRSWFDDGSPRMAMNYDADGKPHGTCVEWSSADRYETRYEHGSVVYVPGRSTVRAFFARMQEAAYDTRGAGNGFYVFDKQDDFIAIFGTPDAGQVPRGINPDQYCPVRSRTAVIG